MSYERVGQTTFSKMVTDRVFLRHWINQLCGCCHTLSLSTQITLCVERQPITAINTMLKTLMVQNIACGLKISVSGTYPTITTILKNGQDKVPATVTSKPTPKHKNLRGSEAYV